MKNFRLTLEFDSDDGMTTWSTLDKMTSWNKEELDITFAMFEAVIRRSQEEVKAQQKRIRAAEHRENNGHEKARQAH
jgi:hypothetical protein